MKQAIRIAVLGLMLVTMAGYAEAQVAGAVKLGTTVEVTKAIAVGHRASKIIGAPVYNERDERVGTIDDLVVTPDRALSYAVVSVGGFLGLGRKLVAIPVEQIRDENGKLLLPGATKEALKGLPEFEYVS